MIPTWLEQHLIRTGAMTENRVTENAKPRRCPTCNLYTLVALDAPTCALEIALDAYPTTAAGETFALLTGRTTYEITHAKKLIHRETAEIRMHHADTKGNVHATHQCHSPPLPMHPAFQARIKPAPVVSDTPPY